MKDNKVLKFRKELYSKIALIKAAYNYTDLAYIHIDADDDYYYVTVESKKQGHQITENDFVNEMLAQSVRHEVYQQTKNIRKLLLARAMATSVIVDDDTINEEIDDSYVESEVLRDWFEENENN